MEYIPAERPHSVLTKYGNEVITTIQYLGAKVTGDNFFPRWRVYQFFHGGFVRIERLEDTREWEITVISPDEQNTATRRVKFSARDRRMRNGQETSNGEQKY